MAKKRVVIKFLVDYSTNTAFRKLLKIKNSTIQSLMEKLLKDCIYENLEEIINYDK